MTLEVPGLDRLYLNVYVPKLQRELGVVGFLRYHRGHRFASAALLAPLTDAFTQAIDDFTPEHALPVLPFAQGQRQDAVALDYRARFTPAEGVLFVGKAQEKTPVFRTQKRKNPTTGRCYPGSVRSTALVHHDYFYCVDEDFGPFFLQFCSYFPYNAKRCLNGHEDAKRQLAKEGSACAALANGIRSCADPRRLQELGDGLSAEKIEALLRKWLARLPHPFPAADRQAGYRYDISILQAECSLTQVLDRPQTGRIVFEEVLRANLDSGRPDQVPLIFGRRVTRRTPGRFRTRVLTAGVTPALPVDYQKSRIKQYHKEERALRTETTIKDPRDVGIGKRLKNLPALRAVGFQAHRRLLDVQTISQDCAVGAEVFRQVTQPREVNGQRARALRYGDACVRALVGALLVFRLLPRGFCNRALREHVAPLLGEDPGALTQGRMTYQLRRRRLHGLSVRQAGTPRYAVTEQGLRVAWFCTRS